ncbi:MAG: glycerol-3-phosphate dehydrogenase, partial [Succinivibrio sp.]|nr:glycerol-3-phosphate dehydrogenase [Succinivibrio sp.]
GAGLSDGLGFGANARTALISRGLAEMTRLGLAFGATEKSFMGLSGLGDLILTCTDNQSRNRRFGFFLGQGLSCQDALNKIGQVVEGYTMSKVVRNLCDKTGVQMPICHEVYEIIYNGKSGLDAAMSLLGRSLKSE